MNLPKQHLAIQTMNICESCSKRQKTCCETTDIFVSLGDIRRIESYMGLDASDFSEKRQATEDYLSGLNEEKDPNWSITIDKDNNRRVLKKDDEKCCFLGDGCTLPLEIKPLVCRIYPWDFEGYNVVIGTPDCPKDLLEKNKDKLIGISYKAACDWAAQLQSELLEEIELESKLTHKK
jgi:Fe-S-cluster containining protein